MKRWLGMLSAFCLVVLLLIGIVPGHEPVVGVKSHSLQLVTYAWAANAPPAPWIASTPAPRLSPAPSRLPVLVYHHLVPVAVGRHGSVIEVKEFATQMAWLRENGYTAITTAELEGWLMGEAGLPARPVLITFDDGYRSNYEYAYPLLKQHGMRATLFMVSGLMGKTVHGTAYLKPEEIREMWASTIFEVQAHSHDAHRMVGKQAQLIDWSEEEVAADLAELEGRFTGAGLLPPTAYAYPYGAHDEEVLRALKGGGIRLGFVGEPGYVQRSDSPYALRRLVIYPGMEIREFADLVTGKDAGCRD